MFKTILMAVDGSPAVERLLVYTEHMARRSDAQVVVVHAYEVPEVYDWTESYAQLEAHFEQVANEVAADAVEALEKAGIHAVADVRRGPAAPAILEAARVHQADLIIMGSRALARSNVAEALLGSVSAAVLRNTYCPTLIVP
ncbi:universal stress protein [Litorilinea aerophila]|uniref:Universal stress protein n=1 Tax=Litorilinea aerophila TaxID=1204385 RepID=A0A540VB01_9CHLR|nr:universal stress protein [Litorilinea aerophila]MCC9078217.1 universal stress protein [Litorilinea aerophila]GIV80185.1 MAG: universal stress protein [Litorilinea sp.]